MLCELLDLKSEALDSYLAAYRANPDHPGAAYHLGLHYLENRKHDLAIRYLQKAVQIEPQNGAAHLALGTALQSNGLNGAARRCLQRASELDAGIHKLLGDKAQARSSTKGHVLPAHGLNATEADLDSFLRLFSGREGVFAKQWASDDGRLGYNAIYRPLTREEIRLHLEGQQTLGFYLMRADNTVSQLIFDLDLTRQVRVDFDLNGQDAVSWKNLMWQHAMRISQILSDLSLKVYLEDSGFKGLHLWFFLAAPIPARDVLLLAKKVLALAGAPPPGLSQEIFPKEERIGSQALGALVKLPLGIHRLTNRRCWFLDSQGQPVLDQLAVLRNIETVSTNQFMAGLDKAKDLLTAPLEVEPPADRTEVDKVFAGCNVLRHFRDKAEKTKWLNHVERLTLAAVLGHLGKAGHQTVHQIIRHTTNYNYRITQKWLERVKGYPISCPKIRERHSDITPAVGCCCQFRQIRNSYPSPVLHADPEMVIKIKARVAEREAKSEEGGARSEERVNKDEERKARSEERGKDVERGAKSGERGKYEERGARSVERTAKSEAQEAQSTPSTLRSTEITTLFQNYLQHKKHQRELVSQIGAIEQKLNAFCDQSHTEEFTTELGTFKRIKVGRETRWVMEI